jgi:hypothetical protein
VTCLGLRVALCMFGCLLERCKSAWQPTIGKPCQGYTEHLLVDYPMYHTIQCRIPLQQAIAAPSDVRASGSTRGYFDLAGTPFSCPVSSPYVLLHAGMWHSCQASTGQLRNQACGRLNLGLHWLFVTRHQQHCPVSSSQTTSEVSMCCVPERSMKLVKCLGTVVPPAGLTHSERSCAVNPEVEKSKLQG